MAGQGNIDDSKNFELGRSSGEAIPDWRHEPVCDLFFHPRDRRLSPRASAARPRYPTPSAPKILEDTLGQPIIGFWFLDPGHCALDQTRSTSSSVWQKRPCAFSRIIPFL